MSLIVEAEFSPGMSLTESQELARLIERAGFDRLGISDVILWPDTFIVQTLCAQATERIHIGAMVTNPYSRHPAVIASAAADLANLSAGRAFLGMGMGAGLEAVGIEYLRPVHTLREAISMIRALLAGERVEADGSIFRSTDAQLRCPPVQSVPIAIGTRSPGVMRLAGEVADRALVGARYMSASTAATYRRWLAEGAAAAGRSADDVEMAPRLTLCVSHDAGAAYRTMRRDAAEFLVTLRPSDLEIEPERLDAIARVLAEARGWYFDPDAYHPPALEELVDDNLVRHFAVCGCPDECVDQMRRIVAMGFSSVSLKLAPVRHGGMPMFDGLRETVSTFAEVLPEVKSLA